jgi:glucose-fructose oxidoreductase
MKKRTPAQRKNPPVRYAVVGLGHIAQVAVLPAFAHAKGQAQLSALVSGDPEKLKKLGRKYRVKNLFSYEEYEACLESGEVDAVYIALPNSLHADYSVRALERGVHVLCEKPMALSEEECQRMIEAAKESGAKLMMAYRLHFEEANLKAIQFARRKLGELKYFNSSFSFQIRDKDNIRLRGEEGGNPLWDIGVYCINAARYFFRDEPFEVFASGTRSGEERFAEVEDTVAAILKFPGDRLASFVVSFGAGDVASYDVLGDKGRLHLESAYEYVFPRELTLTIGENSKKFRFKKVDQFAPELVYFAECIRKNRMPEPSGYEGWADVRIIRSLEESLRSGRAVSLPPPPRPLAEKPRPRVGQWIERPPVREPDTVNAENPAA